VARNSIKSLFGHDVNEIDLSRCSAAVYSHCGAFVTLHKHGQLRGCIGMIESENPLIHTIRQMAVSAAIHDYRFPPVAEHELEQIEIEISVLSPLKKIDDISQIVLGKHGIYLRKGSASGVFYHKSPMRQDGIWNSFWAIVPVIRPELDGMVGGNLIFIFFGRCVFGIGVQKLAPTSGNLRITIWASSIFYVVFCNGKTFSLN